VRSTPRSAKDLLDLHDDLLDAYRPDDARVAVVFEPIAYQLDWAQHGAQSSQAQPALEGCLAALERLQIPYDVLESRHRARLAGYRLILMPWPLFVEPELADALLAWVRAGGTLLAESELDAYDRLGFYRYPDERPFASALDVHSLGRRPLADPTFGYELNGRRGELPAAVWLEPLHVADHDQVLVAAHAVSNGRVIAVGSFPSIAYARDGGPGFEALIRGVADDAGALPELRCRPADGEIVQWRTGRSGDQRLVFVINAGPATAVTLSGPALSGAPEVRELVSDAMVACEATGEAVELTVRVAADGYAILVWPEPVAT
jgi:beta-galactosidase